MEDHNKNKYAKVIRTVDEWHGIENLDDIHVELLRDMVTFAVVPIAMGICENIEEITNQLTQSVVAAFNLGYAKGRSEHASKT